MNDTPEISTREVLSAGLAFAALTVAITWPQLRESGVSGFSPDILRNVWVLQWDLHALVTSPLELFDANIFYPASKALALNDHLLGVLPIWLVFYLPTGDAHASFNLTALTMYALTGWATYLLARYLTLHRSATANLLAVPARRGGLASKRWHGTDSIWGATAAGIIAAFHPIKMYHFGILPVISYAWFPLILLMLELFRDTGRKRWLLLASVLYALQLMSGYYNAYAITLALGAYLLVSWAQFGEWRRPSRMVLPAVALLAAIAVNVPMALPYMYQEKGRAIANPEEGRDYFLPNLPAELFKTPLTNKIYGKIMGMGDYEVPQPLFPGVIFPLLAIFGLVYLTRKNGDERVPRTNLFVRAGADTTDNTHGQATACPWHPALWRFGIPGILLASLSLGSHPLIFGKSIAIPLPYALFAWIVPGFHNIRVPQRFAYTALVFGAIFASFGITWLVRKKSKRWSKAAAGIICLAAVLAEVWTAPLYIGRKPEFRGIPEIYNWLKKAKIDGAVLELPIDNEKHMLSALYTYMSPHHWKHIANGYSAYSPATYKQIRRTVRLLPQRDALRLLDLAGVHTIVEHGDIYSWISDPESAFPYLAPPKDTVVGRLEEAEGDGLRLVARIGKDTVWQIDLPPEDTVSTGTLHILGLSRTPEGEDVIVMEVNGDGGKIWKNSRPGEAVSARLIWHQVGRGVTHEREVVIPAPIAALGSPMGDIYVFTEFPSQSGTYELEMSVQDDRVRGTLQRVDLHLEERP